MRSDIESKRDVETELRWRLPDTDQRPDPEIARETVTVLKGQLPHSSEHIKAVVKNGRITVEAHGGEVVLTGTVRSWVGVNPGTDGILRALDDMARKATV